MDGKSLNTRAAAVSLWTVLVLTTVVVGSRRFSGAYTGPLPIPALIVATLLAVAGSLLALGLFRRHSPREDSLLIAWLPELITLGLPTLFVSVIAAGATPTQAGTLMGIAAVGAVVLGVTVLETTGWGAFLQPSLRVATPAPVGEIPPESPARNETAEIIPGSAEASPALHIDEAVPEEEDEDDEATTQWMTRRTEPDGEEIEGTVRVHFAAGQREAIVHVTFCPPLLSTPNVELEVVDGDDWQIKTEAAFPYGVRIQVRRGTRITSEQIGRIAYLATAAGHSRAA